MKFFDLFRYKRVGIESRCESPRMLVGIPHLLTCLIFQENKITFLRFILEMLASIRGTLLRIADLFHLLFLAKFSFSFDYIYAWKEGT